MSDATFWRRVSATLFALLVLTALSSCTASFVPHAAPRRPCVGVFTTDSLGVCTAKDGGA